MPPKKKKLAAIIKLQIQAGAANPAPPVGPGEMSLPGPAGAAIIGPLTAMSEEGFLPGTILAGRYQVRRELGRGGMGVVYLCRDLVIDERVAVKLLDRSGAAARPEDAWWFQEEARALAGLSHPALVKARDFGALGFPTLYVVRPDGSVHSSHVGVVTPEALEAAVAEWTGAAGS